MSTFILDLPGIHDVTTNAAIHPCAHATKTKWSTGSVSRLKEGPDQLSQIQFHGTSENHEKNHSFKASDVILSVRVSARRELRRLTQIKG